MNKNAYIIYQSPKTLSYPTIGSFIALLLIYASFALGSLIHIISPTTYFNMGDGNQVPMGLAVIGMFAFFEIPLRILTIVFFLMWLYRCYKNLTPLRSESVEFTPGWSVGWWFIPIANLFKPFQVMSELWNQSDAEIDEEMGFLSGKGGSPTIIVFWWAFFIISNIIYRISEMAIDNEGNVASIFATLFFIASVIHIIAGVLIILIIKTITRKQEERFQGLENPINELPPQPPVFNQ